MLKYLGATGLLLGFVFAAVPPATAAECGVLALLSPCAPTPPPAPLPLPIPVPGLDGSLPVAPEPVTPPAPPAAVPSAPVPVAVQKALLPDAAETIRLLVNRERAGAGLPALAASPRIASIASGHSMAMAGRGDIWHNDAYFSAANRRALGAKALGENVAMNATIEDAHRRLMASPGHRANIMNASFDAVGMAVVQDERGMLYVTQDFADWQGEPAAAGAARPAAPVAARPAAAKPASPTRAAPRVVVPRPAPAPASATPVRVHTASVLPVGPVADSVAAVMGDGTSSEARPAPVSHSRHLPVALAALVLLAGITATCAGLRASARRSARARLESNAPSGRGWTVVTA